MYNVQINIQCYVVSFSGSTYDNLLEVLNEGLITEEYIDTSVIRLMHGFISLGVLDPPDTVPYNKYIHLEKLTVTKSQ